MAAQSLPAFFEGGVRRLRLLFFRAVAVFNSKPIWSRLPLTFYKSQRWHSGEKRGFRLNVRRVAAAAAFASAEHFQRENALRQFQRGTALKRLATFIRKTL
ncbi:hypothetical protein [Desulfovibrio sp. ZJ200]|uniref:hypothetical protein n=1 Tax=Desulfovibrio sp. ZJ200 TaxID=2709792 RepID=UPI00197F88BC|nr:hypothetical protein [Desulfovibrio sp. ZJ200]